MNRLINLIIAILLSVALIYLIGEFAYCIILIIQKLYNINQVSITQIDLFFIKTQEIIILLAYSTFFYICAIKEIPNVPLKELFKHLLRNE